jgi:hypothetical protein
VPDEVQAPLPLIIFSKGITLERGVNETGQPAARLRDPAGVGSWGAPDKPLFLDRRIPGERYLTIPALAAGLDRLWIIGRTISPMKEEAEKGEFGEGWAFGKVKAFPNDVTWEQVTRNGQECHRLTQDGVPSEWSYAEEPAFLRDQEGKLEALVLNPGQSGQAPSELLLEVMDALTGLPEEPPLGMTGLLYLRSEPKPGTSHPTAIAKVVLENGVIKQLQLLEGNATSYSRFPDVESGEMEIVEWTAFLSERIEWPCWNTLFEPKRLIWQKARNYKDLMGMLWAEELPMNLLLPRKNNDPLWQ